MKHFSLLILLQLGMCMGMDCAGNMPVGSPLPLLNIADVRVLQAGDFWLFEDRRDGFENGLPFTLIGTTKSIVLPGTTTDFVGNTARISASTTNLIQQEDGIPITSMGQIYFTQDPNGTAYTHGFLDDTVNPPEQRFVKVPVAGKVLSAPSPIILGPISTTSAIVYDDGTTETGGSTAVAFEKVTVPAGSFIAVRIEGSAAVTQGTKTRTVTTTSWFVPELGAGVKSSTTVTIRDDVNDILISLQIETQLKETNIPYSGG